MPKKNFDHAVTSLDGEPIKHEKTDKPLLVRDVLANALLNDAPGAAIDGGEKIRRFELAQKIHKGGDVDLLAEDIVLLKDQLTATYTSLVAGQVLKHLNA